MSDSDPLPLSPVNNNSFTKMKGGYALNQVMTFKVSNMQRIMHMMQRMAQKSCRRAFQLFCCPIDTLLCEKAAWIPAQEHQPTEAKSTQVALRNPPSTILIVNISNSTLIDCVIGNDTYPSAVAESQPLVQEPELHLHDHMRCNCNHGQWETPLPPVCPPPPSQDHPRISISSSHLNCVIIGDNNYMHAEQTHLPETEEQQM